MSKAYYYCKNFSFKEVNNLFAYSIKDPSVLTTNQKIVRLYKGTLRKLFAAHIFTTRKVNYDRFYEEQHQVREDFDKIYKSTNKDEIEAMLEKYELYIEQQFEPYAAMHECRPHSNMNGKMLIYGPEAIATDYVGFYSKDLLVHGRPTQVHFHEEYPHLVTTWVYDEKFLDPTFNYEDLEQQYKDKGAVGESGDELKNVSGEEAKEKFKSLLDQAHSQHQEQHKHH